MPYTKTSRLFTAMLVLVCLGSIGDGRLAFPHDSLPHTVALWLFDEQPGIYPSSVLNDSGPHDTPMVIGNGGEIVKGKFGNALDFVERPPIVCPSGPVEFGLSEPPKQEEQSVPPLTWRTADFAALMTRGEKHLRSEVGFVNATDTQLNLGAFDWTVEFWLKVERKTPSSGTVFEIGRGPRGANHDVTDLELNADESAFVLINTPSGTRLVIPSKRGALQPDSPSWHHFAFVYSESQHQLRHYVDGVLQPLPAKANLKALAHGDQTYFTVGRDGSWRQPLQGAMDELRFSTGDVYHQNFNPPGSFAPDYRGLESQSPPKAGPPLLFAQGKPARSPIPLGSRKYLFIDGAIVDMMKDITFKVNPPAKEQRVLEWLPRLVKHITVVQDKSGLIRLYYEGPADSLAVVTSKDGVHWQAPDLGHGEYHGQRNIAIRDPVDLGTVFIDPDAPPQARWKCLGGFKGRGIYIYTSSDGFTFKRISTAVLPFRPASQSDIFYDDQRELYVAYHRSDFAETSEGATQREFVRTEVRDLLHAWPFRPVNQKETWEAAKHRRLRQPQPWYLDNGPLTPGGFGIEYPTAFGPEPDDPPGTDIYVPQAIKYPWAPDTYLGFPSVYFHYWKAGPETRRILGTKERHRGSGIIETQLAVSRDGIHWKRYHRPVYVGIGEHEGRDIHMTYMAEGIVRRGDEIWQYYVGDNQYHSSWSREPTKRAVYRVVQRLDRFVAAEASYTGGYLETKPFIFSGNRLVLNLDTGATGFAQVGFLDSAGHPIKGYTVNDCIYINGDFLKTQVEWKQKGRDVSSLEGKLVRLLIRMRGTKLYGMQFVHSE